MPRSSALSPIFPDLPGHLMVFRELHNAEPSQAVKLRLLAGRTVALTDLLTRKTATQVVSPAGTIDLALPRAPDFGFFRYTVK